ncbi:MAG: phenylalanine--tRNA ligase subunit beta [Gammaproteobacteria bacterium]|nr:MAG: phenylalanine--tRNA ligase subunit beta [Gammaproteobacteria bacterium]
MKVPYSWLQAWTGIEKNSQEIADQLTMAGLEVDAIEPVAPPFQNVVVAQVVDCRPHPDADKLKLCQVSDGAETWPIVCGAPNVTAGLKVPLAKIGATLPGGLKIKKAKLRGQLSMGMLCSAKELGLSEDGAGLMELPPDAPVGEDLRRYLLLDDEVIDIDLTPNRGDCLGIRGIAREVAALNSIVFRDLEVPPVTPVIDDRRTVEIKATEGCGRYLGRIVRGIDSSATTPIWMVERLRRAGIRAIHPVVDVTNYVLIELGHPMHGFDLAEIEGGIQVRWAASGEKLVLLDGREIELAEDCLLIADERKPLALAGIMGGEHSGVSDQTSDVFLESAWFHPLAITGRARRFGLHTDASHRYERGVDPELQRTAMERATQLLVEIAGGQPGPIVEAVVESCLPKREPILLRHGQIGRSLGIAPDQAQVENILERLGMNINRVDQSSWRVTPPSYRFDIAIEADLVEEIARLYGYNNIPEQPPLAALHIVAEPEANVSRETFKQILISRGLTEVITYAFVDRERERCISPNQEPKALLNPISSDLAVMRTSLWQGLLNTVSHNLRHRIDRIRIFETGLVFLNEGDDWRQVPKLAFALVGTRLPEPLYAKEKVDFFDGKGLVETLFSAIGKQPRFSADVHPALHPGRTARITVDGQPVGWLGEAHPNILREFGIKTSVILAELDEAALRQRTIPEAPELGKFPNSQRDLAIVVDESVSAQAILDSVRASGAEYLLDVQIFDIYRGKGIDFGRKSVALGLTFGVPSRTLNDTEVNEQISHVLAKLENDFNAKLRA